jgi:hypothetical protein
MDWEAREQNRGRGGVEWRWQRRRASRSSLVYADARSLVLARASSLPRSGPRRRLPSAPHVPPAELAPRCGACVRTSDWTCRRSRSTSAASIARSSRKHAASPRPRRAARSASSRSTIRSCTGCDTRTGAAPPGSRPNRAASGSAQVPRARKAQATTPMSTSPPSTRGRSPLARRARPPARHARTQRAHHRAAAAIPDALAKAFGNSGRDVAVRFRELVDARLYATAAGNEVWVAIATQAADRRFVDERLRDVLFRLVFDAAEAELWEPRADWPLGELAWFDVARLGLRGLA